MVFRPSFRVMLQGSDDSFYYFWVRSPVVDGDLDFRNDLASAPTIDESARVRAQAEPLTPLGRVRNKYPVGWAVASLPFFLMAHAIALLSGAVADGWQPVYFVVIWLGHLGYTIVGLLAARRVLAHYLDAEAATVGVLVGWLCSPLLYYQTARVSMPHGLAFTLCAVLYERTLACRRDPARRTPWIAAGAVAGLLLITRPLCAPYLLFPLAALGGLLRDRAMRATVARRFMWALAPAAALLFLQLLAQHALYGTWRVDTYDGETFDFSDPHLAGSLFSPRHGWFYWHPLLLMGATTFVIAVFRRQLPATWLMAMLIVTYVNSSWWCWWWGSSFGNRSFECATLFVMAGWGFIWLQSRATVRTLRLTIVTIAVGILANAVLLALFLRGAIHRGEAVPYEDMLSALLRQIAAFAG